MTFTIQHKKVFRKIAAITTLCFVFLIILGITVPMLYKDKILNIIKTKANESLNARLDFQDLSLSLFKGFPNLLVDIDEFQLIGIDTFAQDTLLYAKKIQTEIDIMRLIKNRDDVVVKAVDIISPIIKVHILADSTTNYMIFKEENNTETTSSSKQSLSAQIDRFRIKKGKLRYIDGTTNTIAIYNDFSISSQIEYTNDIVKIQADTDGFTSATYGLMTLLDNVTTTGHVNITYTVAKNSFNIICKDLYLNQLQTMGNALVTIMPNQAMDFNINIEAPEQSFKSLISVLPLHLNPYLDDATTKGTFSSKFSLQGIYDEVAQILPSLQTEISVKDGFIAFKDMPIAIDEFGMNIKMTTDHPQWHDYILIVDNADIHFGDNRLHLDYLHEAKGEQATVTGALIANLNLLQLKNTLPTLANTKLSGQLQSDVHWKNVRQSDVMNAYYDRLNVEGGVNINDFLYSDSLNNTYRISDLSMSLSPRSLIVTAQNILTPQGQIHLNGNIANPMKLLTNKSGLLSQFIVKSPKLDLTKTIQPTSPTSQQEVSTIKQTSLTTFLKDVNLSCDIYIDTLITEDITLKNVSSKANLSEQKLNISSTRFDIGTSDVLMFGHLEGIDGYLAQTGPLNGVINIQSKQFNYHDLPQTASTDASQNSTTAALPILPEDVYVTCIADLSKLYYKDMTLNNVHTEIYYEPKHAEIKEFNTSTLGGKINFSGVYEQKNNKEALINFKVDLSQIDIFESVQQLELIKYMAPVGKFLKGKMNSTLLMQGKIDANLNPVFSTLNASGFLETLSSNVINVPVMRKVSSYLGIEDLSQLKLQNTKNWLEIENGKVTFKPYTFTSNDITYEMYGNHSLDQNINYTLIVDIPKSKIPQNSIRSEINKTWSSLSQSFSQYGIDLNKTDRFKIQIDIFGQLLNPQFKVKPMLEDLNNTKGILVESVQKVKDSIQNVLEQKKNSVLDSANAIKDAKVQEIKSDINKATERLKDSVRTKGKEILEKSIDSIESKILSDTLKSKVEEEIKKNAEKEINTIKDKIKDFNPFKKKGN